VEPIPRAVDAAREAGAVSAQAQMEARRLGHHHLGPEHLLVEARGLTLEALCSAVRGELDSDR